MRRSKLEALFIWHMRVSGVPAPVEEYRFHALRKWRFDFAWPELMLAVEIDGGEYIQGRHFTPKGVATDLEKMLAADRQGWTVLHYLGSDVKSGHAIADLELWLAKAGRGNVDEEEAPRGASRRRRG